MKTNYCLELFFFWRCIVGLLLCQTGAGVRRNTASFCRKTLACCRIGSLQQHYFLFYALEEVNKAVYQAVRFTVLVLVLPLAIVALSVVVVVVVVLVLTVRLF